MNLQAELAYVQTQLSTLQGLPSPNPQNISSVDNKSNVSSASSHIPCMSQQQQEQAKEAIEVSTESVDLSTLFGLEDPVDEDGDLNALAREFLSKYLTGGKCRPSSPI